jgi:uncharacterized protein (DUF433 family)
METELKKAPKGLRFETPLYTVAEAATALGVPTSTFTTWVRGYERRPPNRPKVKGEPIITALKARPGDPSIPFIGLAEGMALAAIRRSGVPMQRIRPALVQLSREIGIEHALASKDLYTDGAELLYDYSIRYPNVDFEDIRELVVVRNQQRVFVPIVRDYLQRIVYGSDGYARLIKLPGYDSAEVIADPKRSFGQPIFNSGAATVRDVLERFWAGETIGVLAKEFGVPAPQIEDVLRATSRQAV